MVRLFGILILAASVLPVAPGARAGIVAFESHLSGPQESPPNASPGIGYAQLIFDTTAHTMHVHVTFSGLLGTTTASHIHGNLTTPGTGTVGIATSTPNFVGFPLGVTGGTYDHLYDMTLASSYSAGFLANPAIAGSTAAAEAALIAGIQQQRAYLNIHTTSVPAGEIRGFFTPVPEPSSVILVGLGAVGAIGGARRRVGRKGR